MALFTASWRALFSAKAFRLFLVRLLPSHLPELSRGLLGTGIMMKNGPAGIKATLVPLKANCFGMVSLPRSSTATTANGPTPIGPFCPLIYDSSSKLESAHFHRQQEPRLDYVIQPKSTNLRSCRDHAQIKEWGAGAQILFAELLSLNTERKIMVITETGCSCHRSSWRVIQMIFVFSFFVCKYEKSAPRTHRRPCASHGELDLAGTASLSRKLLRDALS